METHYHYGVMRRAIALIDRAGGTMSLHDLATHLDMSEAHFQRLFSQWVGVSPKRYQQYLALGEARRMLRERYTTLDAAQGAGLSGSGRLHDLLLRWEAMTPGEYARKGAGLTIRWGVFDTPFGPALVCATARGICGLGFLSESDEATARDDLFGRWPKAEFIHDPTAIAPWVQAALTRRGEAALHLIGGPFQIKVWEALLQVPEGHVTSYSEIADAVGHPRAMRAVGTAVGRNPVSWLIPCHRALRKGGGLGGYHWGLPVKRALLAWESARTDAGEDAPLTHDQASAIA